MNMNAGPMIVIFQDPTTITPSFKLLLTARPPDFSLVGANKYTAGWLLEQLANPYLYEAIDAPLYEGADDLNTAITMAAELYHRCRTRFQTEERLDEPTRIYLYHLQT